MPIITDYWGILFISLISGSQATVIKCKGGTSGGAAVTAAATDCASGVSVCMMTTTYNEAACKYSYSLALQRLAPS